MNYTATRLRDLEAEGAPGTLLVLDYVDGIGDRYRGPMLMAETSTTGVDFACITAFSNRIRCSRICGHTWRRA